jgi:hypothetical protein
MTDESPKLLWRGGDPTKFTALQAALRDESIRFVHGPVYDPAGGFLSSRPYYLEAAPCFEIRVHPEDFERATVALKWVESKETSFPGSSDFKTPENDPLVSVQRLPYNWDSNEATSEAWSGDDEPLAEYLASALRENGIPSRVPDESDHRLRLCVLPQDLDHARAIVRAIVEDAPNE